VNLISEHWIWKGYGRKRSWHNTKYCTGVCMEGGRSLADMRKMLDMRDFRPRPRIGWELRSSGHYAAKSGNFLPTFWDNISVLSSGLKNSRIQEDSGPHKPEERSSQNVKQYWEYFCDSCLSKPKATRHRDWAITDPQADVITKIMLSINGRLC